MEAHAEHRALAHAGLRRLQEKRQPLDLLADVAGHAGLGPDGGEARVAIVGPAVRVAAVARLVAGVGVRLQT